jgi:hypothetical protein
MIGGIKIGLEKFHRGQIANHRVFNFTIANPR